MLINVCTIYKKNMTRYTHIDHARRMLIPLQVKPVHQEVPSITGSVNSSQAGTVFYGHYSMDYRLPQGDRLRLLANHDQKTVQILLLTHQPEKLKNLPGKRPSSLVASTIADINRYCIRSESYAKPKTKTQLAKMELAEYSIRLLSKLLPEERNLLASDWSEQETLRQKIITIIEQCRDSNRLLANNPVVSEGFLDTILYESKQTAQHYEFNRVFPVSRVDQLDFCQDKLAGNECCFVWDSEIHIGHDEEALNDSIRVICEQYGLIQAQTLEQVPANRFERLEQFLIKIWQDGRDWIDHLANDKRPAHTLSSDPRVDGLLVSRIKPYYHFSGLHQKGYASLDIMVNQFTGQSHDEQVAASSSQARQLLSLQAEGNWVNIVNQNQLIIRHNNEMVRLNYYEEEGLFYPLPDGQDLYTLSQISKKHLFLPQKIYLQFHAFFSRLPQFFKYTFQSLRQFVMVELYEEFVNHIHQDHQEKIEETEDLNQDDQKPYLHSIEEILHGHGLLGNGQTLEEFVAEKLSEKRYVIVREQHQASPPAYENPLHRSLDVVRHIAGFFIDTSEKNPIIGSLAMAAYLYGAGAVIAPHALAALLTKLHLSGLIAAIKPTQALGQWMSHGPNSEAISSAVTYWQAIILGGNLDHFFIKAISVLQDDPAEVAIIVALAIGLGYSLCHTIPSLQEEMGTFPYVNYAALGAKGGAAIYDTVMHPGHDWFLGTIKWLLKAGLTTGKIAVAPIVESYHYGFSKGLFNGLLKSFSLLIKSIKQTVVALIDLLLLIATIPLLEISAMLIHVPYRGITSLVSKLLGALGNWQVLGHAFLHFANRPSGWNFLPGFRLSPLYGFSNPFADYSEHLLLNLVANTVMLIFLPPLQLIKNVALLPLLDSLSFLTRLTLTILNPVSRGLALTIGMILTKTGFFWDNSLGYLFRGSAWVLTTCSNHLDNEASELKQACLGVIQYLRRGLYDWGFAEEDKQTHQINSDEAYFLEKPMRMEQLPHDQNNCLLQSLLNNRHNRASLVQEQHFPRLFSKEAENNELPADDQETLALL